MEWYFYLILILAGILSGFINTLAGNGSIITLPLLMFIGLPPNVANATNRIGIFLQSGVSVAIFKKQKVFEYKEGVWFAIPATIGSLLGAIAAVKLSSFLMVKIMGGIFFLMFFIVLYKPEKWIQEKAEKIEGRPGFWQIMIFFLIGLYGGFIQAGVGLLLLAGLVYGTGVNLIRANALKVFIMFVFTSFTLVVFIITDQISYLPGFILAFGSIIGAFIASKVAIESGPKVVRIILLIILLISALKYSGAIDLVVRILY